MANEDQISESELKAVDLKRLVQVLDNSPYVATVLNTIAAWLQKQGDIKGELIVTKCALQFTEHESILTE